MDGQKIDEIIFRGIDRIVIVFDVDNEDGLKSKLLSENFLKSRIKSLRLKFLNRGYNIKIEFVPVVYSAETIMLYQYISDLHPETNIESLVHKLNTNKFQLILLTKLIGYKHIKRAKRVQDYLNLEKLKFKIRNSLKVRNTINKNLLNWILEDCNIQREHFSEKDTLIFLQEVIALFEGYQGTTIDFKVGEKEYNNQISLDKFIKEI